MGKWMALGIAGLLLVAGLTVMGSYNALVALDQDVQAQWGQVQSVYQRRADLVPNLVETVKGAANFEQSTLTAITEARTAVQKLAPEAPKGHAAFKQYEQAQAQLSAALSRLSVTVEAYPDLKASGAYRDLMAQLEGSENRISVERMRLNDAARAFNTRRDTFPTVLLAGFLGEKYAEKPYFTAQAGAESAPRVKF